MLRIGVARGNGVDELCADSESGAHALDSAASGTDFSRDSRSRSRLVSLRSDGASE